MVENIRYVHTNLVAKDWRNLADFYIRVFGCQPIPPERDISGLWIEKCTGVSGAHIRGVHLRLPGCGDSGPSLEIFEYDQKLEKTAVAANREGFGHLAFHVDSVEEARDEVLAAGGCELGELVRSEVPGVGLLTVIYVTDPEGNIIEFQNWKKPEAQAG
jgi:predicted enzyme related to lactoylglutathione lyase